jgi:hypothetical protein
MLARSDWKAFIAIVGLVFLVLTVHVLLLSVKHIYVETAGGARNIRIKAHVPIETAFASRQPRDRRSAI